MMIQDDPERGLKERNWKRKRIRKKAIPSNRLRLRAKIQTRRWAGLRNPRPSLKGDEGLAKSDNLYSAINTLISYRSELNIHIKSSLEIRERFKFRNSELPYLLTRFFIHFYTINTPYIRGRRRLCRE